MGAASSIVILDYDINYQKFRVFKRIEIPRSEYTYDNAVNKIIEVNEIYRPAFIYVDAGAGKINKILPFWVKHYRKLKMIRTELSGDHVKLQ